MSAHSTPNSLPNGSDITLPWHLRLPGSLESDFRHYFRSTVLKAAPIALIMTGLLLITGLCLEYIIDPEILLLSWRPRLFSLMVVGGCLVLAIKPALQAWFHYGTIFLALTISLSGDYLGMVVDNPLGYVFFFQTPLAIVLICILIRVPFYAALVCSLAMAGFMALSLLYSPYAQPYQFSAQMLLCVAFTVMSLFGQYIYERLLRQHFLSEHVLYQHRNELHSANRVLASQATVDGMTGCINRRGMEDRLGTLFHQMNQDNATAPQRVSLLLFDIDFFKQYNDTYGHPAGDECLKRVADVPLSMVLNEADFVARYGGEEFVIVLTDSSFNDALVFAERMRNRVEQLGQPHSGSRVSQVVTISVGVACSDGKAENGDALLKQADEALYQAKGAGRNRVCLMNNQGDVEALS